MPAPTGASRVSSPLSPCFVCHTVIAGTPYRAQIDHIRECCVREHVSQIRLGDVLDQATAALPLGVLRDSDYTLTHTHHGHNHAPHTPVMPGSATVTQHLPSTQDVRESFMRIGHRNETGGGGAFTNVFARASRDKSPTAKRPVKKPIKTNSKTASKGKKSKKGAAGGVGAGSPPSHPFATMVQEGYTHTSTSETCAGVGLMKPTTKPVRNLYAQPPKGSLRDTLPPAVASAVSTLEQYVCGAEGTRGREKTKGEFDRLMGTLLKLRGITERENEREIEEREREAGREREREGERERDVPNVYRNPRGIPYGRRRPREEPQPSTSGVSTRSKAIPISTHFSGDTAVAALAQGGRKRERERRSRGSRGSQAESVLPVLPTPATFNGMLSSARATSPEIAPTPAVVRTLRRVPLQELRQTAVSEGIPGAEGRSSAYLIEALSTGDTEQTQTLHKREAAQQLRLWLEGNVMWYQRVLCFRPIDPKTVFSHMRNEAIQVVTVIRANRAKGKGTDGFEDPKHPYLDMNGREWKKIGQITYDSFRKVLFAEGVCMAKEGSDMEHTSMPRERLERLKNSAKVKKRAKAKRDRDKEVSPHQRLLTEFMVQRQTTPQ
ncbi:hypothetical protein KIPB_001774 [Kipferlia bialata]|uniref:Uncharacterized protein n=1 Tax=Kipferlia bialata TaxID=797122 RepID=A0A9K3CQG4_9EUKA|nr:hypothetical protein KIPB_001774 [Kipferlia bialata]|eukprot:g1774.t1